MKFTPERYAIKDEPMKNFIDPVEIEEMLTDAVPEATEVRRIIEKSLSKQRLSMQETAALLNTKDTALVEEIKEGARLLKKRVYGERIVLFAPLYVGFGAIVYPILYRICPPGPATFCECYRCWKCTIAYQVINFCFSKANNLANVMNP